jgi:hypothetical protein
MHSVEAKLPGVAGHVVTCTSDIMCMQLLDRFKGATWARSKPSHRCCVQTTQTDASDGAEMGHGPELLIEGAIVAGM